MGNSSMKNPPPGGEQNTSVNKSAAEEDDWTYYPKSQCISAEHQAKPTKNGQKMGHTSSKKVHQSVEETTPANISVAEKEHSTYAAPQAKPDDLHTFIGQGKWGKVDELLNHGVDVTTHNQDGRLPLHMVYKRLHMLRSGRIDDPFVDYRDTCNIDYRVVNKLISMGSLMVNVPDMEGWTILHDAAWHRDWQMMEMLLEAGADVSLSMAHGRTPLYCLRYTPAPLVHAARDTMRIDLVQALTGPQSTMPQSAFNLALYKAWPARGDAKKYLVFALQNMRPRHLQVEKVTNVLCQCGRAHQMRNVPMAIAFWDSSCFHFQGTVSMTPREFSLFLIAAGCSAPKHLELIAGKNGTTSADSALWEDLVSLPQPLKRQSHRVVRNSISLLTHAAFVSLGLPKGLRDYVRLSNLYEEVSASIE